jgi:hypothetical protein
MSTVYHLCTKPYTAGWTLLNLIMAVWVCGFHSVRKTYVQCVVKRVFFFEKSDLKFQNLLMKRPPFISDFLLNGIKKLVLTQLTVFYSYDNSTCFDPISGLSSVEDVKKTWKEYQRVHISREIKHFKVKIHTNFVLGGVGLYSPAFQLRSDAENNWSSTSTPQYIFLACKGKLY